MLRAASRIVQRVRRPRRVGVGFAIPVLACILATVAGCARQTDKVARIGFLSSVPSTLSEGFRAGLKEQGLVEGSNITIEWRWTEGKAERSPALAAELVALKPDLIVTTSGQPTAVAKAATSTIPIVFIAAGDPVRSGLVASMAKPGGNLTGLANLVSEGFTGKMIEMLLVAVPKASRVGVLMNPKNTDHQQVRSRDLPIAAQRLGLNFVTFEVEAVGDLDAAFEGAVRAHADAVLVLGDPLIYVHRERIADLAASRRLPALYFFRENVEAGGLMSYGMSLYDLGRRGAAYVDKILKGARPGDLPVEQPVKFDLVVNLKAARALGLALPPELLRQADLLIE